MRRHGHRHGQVAGSPAMRSGETRVAHASLPLCIIRGFRQRHPRDTNTVSPYPCMCNMAIHEGLGALRKWRVRLMCWTRNLMINQNLSDIAVLRNKVHSEKADSDSKVQGGLMWPTLCVVLAYHGAVILPHAPVLAPLLRAPAVTPLLRTPLVPRGTLVASAVDTTVPDEYEVVVSRPLGIQLVQQVCVAEPQFASHGSTDAHGCHFAWGLHRRASAPSSRWCTRAAMRGSLASW